MDSPGYIDDYFKGVLTDPQKKEFENRVLSDPAFAEELAFYISAGNVLKEELVAEKKARFRELYEQTRTTASQIDPPRIPPIRRLWPFMAAASVLIVAAGLWWVINRQIGPDRLADEYIRQQLTSLPVKMSSVQDSLEKAISVYNSGRLPEAGNRFEQVLQLDTANEKARLYAGIVCLRLEEYDKALRYFQRVEADTALYSNPGLFYQSLTLMKRNRPGDATNARQLLQQVVDRNLEKKEDAQQLLKKW